MICTTIFAVTNDAFAEVDPAILKEVAAAWKKHEAATKTFDCQFDTEYFRVAKSDSYSRPDGQTIRLPTEDTTVLRQSRLRVSGQDRGRYEYTGPQLIETTQTYEERPFVSLFDRNSKLSYYDRDKSPTTLRFYGIAFLSSAVQLPEIEVLNNLMPLYVAYRPTDWCSSWGVLLANGHSLQEAELRGVRCLFLRLSRINDGYFNMYLDRDNGFVPIQLEAITGTEPRRVSVRADVQYEMNGTLGPTPKTWTTTIFDFNGIIRDQYQNQITSFDVNTRIDESVFRFDIPVGTVVYDQIRGENYIIKEGGQKRMLLRHENINIAEYPRLLATDPVVTSDVMRRRWLIFANAIIAISAVCVFLWRRRNAKRFSK